MSGLLRFSGQIIPFKHLTGGSLSSWVRLLSTLGSQPRSPPRPLGTWIWMLWASIWAQLEAKICQLCSIFHIFLCVFIRFSNVFMCFSHVFFLWFTWFYMLFTWFYMIFIWFYMVFIWFYMSCTWFYCVFIWFLYDF